jgi:hypothetical protein
MAEVAMRGGTRHNMPIKLSVRVVTRRACARRAPTRPAAYCRRYADMKDETAV